MRLIHYGSKIKDHTFIFKGGTICVFFGYRPTRRLEGLSIFAIVYFDVVQGMLVRWAGVGWGSLAFAHQHDGTLEMGWGGVAWG